MQAIKRNDTNNLRLCGNEALAVVVFRLIHPEEHGTKISGVDEAVEAITDSSLLCTRHPCKVPVLVLISLYSSTTQPPQQQAEHTHSQLWRPPKSCAKTAVFVSHSRSHSRSNSYSKPQTITNVYLLRWVCTVQQSHSYLRCT